MAPIRFSQENVSIVCIMLLYVQEHDCKYWQELVMLCLSLYLPVVYKHARVISAFAETAEQVASHEVSPRFWPPSLCRGGASGSGEGGLHRVRAVLREEGVPTSLRPPSTFLLLLLLLLCWPSTLLHHRDFPPGTSRMCLSVDEFGEHKTGVSARWALRETGRDKILMWDLLRFC